MRWEELELVSSGAATETLLVPDEVEARCCFDAECVPEAAGVPVLPGAGAGVGARCFVAERAGAAAAGALMV